MHTGKKLVQSQHRPENIQSCTEEDTDKDIYYRIKTCESSSSSSSSSSFEHKANDSLLPEDTCDGDLTAIPYLSSRPNTKFQFLHILVVILSGCYLKVCYVNHVAWHLRKTNVVCCIRQKMFLTFVNL